MGPGASALICYYKAPVMVLAELTAECQNATFLVLHVQQSAQSDPWWPPLMAARRQLLMDLRTL